MAAPLLSKEAARYTSGGGREHCSLCRHFSPRHGGRCARVLGGVSPQGWCKLFSREIRALVADATSFNGGAGGPTLGLDFMVPGVLDPRITFTRASTGTYFNSAGLMQTAATNTPRWDYDPATLALRGLLLEDARTNIILNSGNAAAWGAGGNVSAPPVLTANQTAAPDGNTTGARVVYPAVSGAGNYSLVNPIGPFVATASPYSLSVWLKGAAGGEVVYLSMTPDGASYYRLQTVLTTAWQRFVLVTNALGAGTNWYCQIGTDRRDASQPASPAQTIYVWGGQLEVGAFGTSYIATAGATATRSADSCGILSASMSPWFVGPGGSWLAEFINNVPTAITSTSPRVIGIRNATSLTPMWISTGLNVGTFDGAQVNSNPNAAVVGAVTKCVSTWAPGTGKICVNSASVVSGAQSVGFATLASAGISIGAGNPGTLNEAMVGYVRRVSYWSRVLTNAEMQAVTAP